MINIEKETGTVQVTNLKGKEFQVNGISIPMTRGEGFLTNLPPDMFTAPFTVEVICEKLEYLPETANPEIINEPIEE